MPQQRARMPQDSPAHDDTTVGAERDGLFDRYASEQPQLLSHQAMADREVPVIVLTPARPSLAPRTPCPAAADAGPASSAAVPEARQ